MPTGTFSQHCLFRSEEKDWNQFAMSTAVIAAFIFIVTQSHGHKKIINILKGQFDQIFWLLFWGSTIYQDQERHMALKNVRSSNDFTLTANVVIQQFFQMVQFLLKCFWPIWKSYWSRQCLGNSVWSAMGHCFKYIELVFSTYPRLLLNIYLVEQPIGNWEICRCLLIGQNAKGKFAEITPVKNVNRRVLHLLHQTYFWI